MKLSALIGIAVIVTALGLAGRALARPGSESQFQITASVAGSCTISAGDVVLGDYDSGTGVTGTGTISYQCTPGTSPSVSLDTGLYGAGDVTRRNLFDGAYSLAYQIYSDPGYSSVWGNGTNGAPPLSVSGDGNADTASVYVEVFSGQTRLNVGSYTDSVTAEIDW